MIRSDATDTQLFEHVLHLNGLPNHERNAGEAQLDRIIPGWRRRVERNLHLLKFLAQGKSNKEIAEAMRISESTVKNNLTVLFNCIKVRDRANAILYAHANGIKLGEPNRHPY